ncbi:hypothetical protein RN001_001635 [Aquatica leii]|uniref:Uncharacterized protein n=1 Tax=Aquatica leii TaxID=1421715 RepID=A0AAN7Q4C7_9COLE|nr:hypothetical protein RN001_001635 [Aquatica leii]
MFVIICIKAQELDEIERSCRKKLNIEEFLIDYNLNQLYMPEGNPSFSKFMGCVWKRKGFIDSKNNLQYDIFTDFIAKRFLDVVGNSKSANALAKDSVNSCMIVKGDTAGQTGIMFMNCVTRLFQN